MRKSNYIQFLFNLSLILLTSVAMKAQDPHLSQFYAAPLQLNPALSGVFSGQYRAILNYREQLGSVLQSNPYRTINASYEYRLNTINSDYVTFGMNILRDETGVSNYTKNAGHLSAAYMKQLTGGGYNSTTSYLVAGGQYGFGQQALDYSGLWFSPQFDKENQVVNTNLSNGEGNILSNTDWYQDINAGLLWYIVLDDNANIYAGASMYHINVPRIGFINQQHEFLEWRWAGHIGGEIPLSSNMSILPSFVYQTQSSSSLSNFGSSLRFVSPTNDDMALRIGAWGRVARKLNEGFYFDSFIMSSLLEINRLNIGLSYDFNISSITKATRSRGGFELSLTYTHPEKSRQKSVVCPKF